MYVINNFYLFGEIVLQVDYTCAQIKHPTLLYLFISSSEVSKKQLFEYVGKPKIIYSYILYRKRETSFYRFQIFLSKLSSVFGYKKYYSSSVLQLIK